MATEAAPKPARGSKTGATRTIPMGKTDPSVDFPRLQNYVSMGYTVKEHPWAYELSCSQEAYDKRQAEYQQKGIDQAERVNKGTDSEGLDNPRETTISTIGRVPMTADDLLSDDSGSEPGMVNP